MQLVASAAAASLGMHQLQLVFATLGAVLWVTLPTAAASAATDMLKAGDAAFGNGDYSTAVRHYTAALEIDPNTPVFFTKRAAAYMAIKKYTQALKDLDRAVELDENSTQGLLSRGKLHRSASSHAALTSVWYFG